MAGVGVPAKDLAARRQFETLRCAFVRLQLKLHLDLSQNRPPRNRMHAVGELAAQESGEETRQLPRRLTPNGCVYPPEFSVGAGGFAATGMADETAAGFVTVGPPGGFTAAGRG